jgi:membrane associated rhomboid family serine protease
MEVIVRVRQDGVEGDLYLHDLEDDIRHGRVPPTAELKYVPWTGDRFLPMGSLEALAEAFDSPSARFALHLRGGPFPWLSTVLTLGILATGLLQIGTLLLGGHMGSWGRVLAQAFADGVTGFDPMVLDGVWWSPWSSQFVHGGPGHLFPNLAVVGYAGFRVERALGVGGYAVVAAASVLFGSVAVALLEPLPVMGSSLLGYGFFGALLAIGFRFGDSIPTHFRRFYGYGNLTLFALLFISGLGAETASHVGHAGGFSAGFLCALILSTETTSPRDLVRRVRSRNLGVALALVGVPAVFGPLARHNPGLLFRGGERVEVLQAGVSLRLPSRLSQNPVRMRGLPAWTTSGVSKEVVFCGLERIAPGQAGEAAFLARWSVEDVGAAMAMESVDPVGPGWTAWRARLPATGQGGSPLQVVEQQLQRGEWLLRLGYVVEETAKGQPGGRSQVFAGVIQSVEVGEVPALARARDQWESRPAASAVSYSVQLARAGQWEAADRVLAQRLAGAEDERAVAARLELWASRPEEITLSALDWVENLEFAAGSVARQVGWTRLHLALGDCEEVQEGLALLVENPLAGGEVPLLEEERRKRCAWRNGVGLGVRLLTQEGQPLPCRATLWRMQGGERLLWPGSAGDCEGGALSWADLEPGAYRLMAQAPGRVLLDRDLVVEEESPARGAGLPDRGGGASGRVVREGQPVEGATVSLSGGRRHAETRPDGSFALEGVALGETRLWASLEKEGARVDVHMTAAGVAIELELETLPEPGVFGLRFEAVPGGARIVAVHPGGPLEGVAVPGDILQTVDGVDLVGANRQDMLQALEGSPGEVSQLVIARGERSLQLEVQRVGASEL